MTIRDLHLILERAGDRLIEVRLPSGDRIPPHFHVTEVGRVDRNFIDCGGTVRHAASCMLQTWTADDYGHRLKSAKLARIIRTAEPLLKSWDLPAELEYGADVASQYAITDFDLSDDAIVLTLAGKKADCLAPDRCGLSGCSTGPCR
jgi:hypothetical protein